CRALRGRHAVLRRGSGSHRASLGGERVNAPASVDPTKRLPFDRYQRYALAARALPLLGDRSDPLQILEFGSNVHGDLGRFVAGHRVVSLDLSAAEATPGAFVRGNGLATPFRDRGFDVALALDVLER